MGNTRVPGVFNFSANYEPLIAGPLDARLTVVNVSELTNNSLPYPYLGMPVIVTSDPDEKENGLWVLVKLPATLKENWRQIAFGDINIKEYTLNGTIVSIELEGGDIFTIDLNEVFLKEEQYATGISNHSYELITTGWTSEVISGDTYNTTELMYGDNLNPAKLNIVLINVDDDTPNHFLLKLPDVGVTSDNGGILYKIIIKNYNNENLDKFLMIYSETKRILAANIVTEYQGSYFLPLEMMESVEILWDGVDYIAINMVKQGYVSLNAKSFIEMNPSLDPLYDDCYIQRDPTINNFVAKNYITNYFQ
jgi:hypothetical protein